MLSKSLMDSFAKKYRGLLKPLQYVVLASGYILMASIIWLIVRTTHLYLTTSISSLIKAPPLAPLIPYFPKIFGLESLFPPLYFTYFLLALAIVAITHEAAHGIFARFYKFKVHSSGFVFLGPLLGAFVEPDEKQMYKAKKFPQLVVLAAGTFANILMTILFGGILLLFFSSLFVPAGVLFQQYSGTIVDVEGIDVIGESSIRDGLLEIEYNSSTYFINSENWEKTLEGGLEQAYVFDDSPAFRQQVVGAITSIDGEKVTNLEELSGVLSVYSPGDEVNIKTAVLNPGQGSVAEIREYDLELGDKNDRAFLGIGFVPMSGRGIIGFFYKNTLAKIKEPLIFYESGWGDFGWFVYYLLWWIVVINFFVALFNMLPLGILDGGRYFYLTIWGLTGKESWGKKSYKFITWFLLALFALLMLKWVWAYF